MSIAATVIYSTIQMTFIEFLLCLVAACSLGYQIGRRKITANLQQKENISHEAIVPIIDSKQSFCQKEKQINEQIEVTSLKCSQKSELRAQIIVPPQDKHIQFQKSESDRFSNELLKEKVELDHKKLQSTSYFETRLESSQNKKFMRKIQKHEIVTDYELETESSNSNMIVPFKNNLTSALSEPHSLLEVVAHQDYNLKLSSPLIQRKFISLGQLSEEWRLQMIPPWILENGRFGKSYYQSKLIGQGGFGRVYEALNLLENKKYAIKKLIMKGMVKIGELMNEVFIISKFSHPNIVNYFSCWIELATIDDASLVSAAIPTVNVLERQSSIKEEKEMMYVQSNSGFTFENNSKKSKTKSAKRSSKKGNQIVPYESFGNTGVNLIQIYTLHIQMELCQTSLHSFMRQRTQVDLLNAFLIFEQILSGLNFLHSNGIVHRDLKPANILLCQHKGQVKIGDFGLAALIEEHSQVIIREKVGTPLYMAPQMQNGAKIQRQKLDLIDIYSLGVIYYELLHLLNLATQHERSEKLLSLQSNKVVFANKELKEEKKMIKLLTKTYGRPNIKDVFNSKEMQELKKKYKRNAQP